MNQTVHTCYYESDCNWDEKGHFSHISEAATGGVLCFKISQNLQVNYCVGDFSYKVAGQNYKQVFFCEFAKFLRPSFLENTSGRLLLVFLPVKVH